MLFSSELGRPDVDRNAYKLKPAHLASYSLLFPPLPLPSYRDDKRLCVVAKLRRCNTHTETYTQFLLALNCAGKREEERRIGLHVMPGGRVRIVVALAGYLLNINNCATYKMSLQRSHESTFFYPRDSILLASCLLSPYSRPTSQRNGHPHEGAEAALPPVASIV